MNIIKSEIVDSRFDVLWNDISLIVKGAEKKPVLVLVSECEAGSAADTQLQKMLDACKLTAADYNIVRLKQGEMVAWHQLRESFSPDVVFLVGVTPGQLGISALFGLNYPNNFDGRTWLPTLSLTELGKNDELKKDLWNNGMKPVLSGRCWLNK